MTHLQTDAVYFSFFFVYKTEFSSKIVQAADKIGDLNPLDFFYVQGIQCIIIIITCFKHDTDWLHVAFNVIQQLQNLFLLFLKCTGFIHKK